MRKKPVMQGVDAVMAVVSILVLGAVDYFTGYYLSFFVFYFIPIALIASRYGAKVAYVFSVFCAATWFASDRFGGHPYPSAWMGIWNAATRLAAFLVVAYTIARIRSLLASAQQEVKVLSGLLPICAKCKKIRDDTGYWHKIESYLSQHTEATFTHGLCEPCYRDALREAGIEESAEPTNPSCSVPALRSPQG
jgi:hypothetical protein